MMRGNGLGIYVHIPFCVRKCPYCGFLSYPMAKKSDLSDYIELLCAEISIAGQSADSSLDVDTIFLGGGTPSLLNGPQIARILDALNNAFPVCDEAERTMEINPGTVSCDDLMAYRRAGINRLSIGVQSFRDKELLDLGRIHTSEGAVQCVEKARIAGFKNINLDLMMGLPGQSKNDWQSSMERAIELRPEHISMYMLQLEPETPYYHQYRKGQMPDMDTEIVESMYLDSVQRLESSGYHQYEISNFSISGKECRHNQKYWNMEPYLGFGLGASSYCNGVRVQNHCQFKEWSERVRSGTLPRDEATLESENQRSAMEYYVMTTLRTTEGMDLGDFRFFFGIDMEDAFPGIWSRLDPFLNRGSVTVVPGESRVLRITPCGFLHSNEILSEFLGETEE